MRSHAIRSFFSGNPIPVRRSLRVARQAVAVAALAILSVGCAVSNRIALPPLPIGSLFDLLPAVLPAGSSGGSYNFTVSTNLSTTGTGTVGTCQFIDTPSNTPGTNAVPIGLRTFPGTPVGGAPNSGCTIAGVIGDTNGDGVIGPGEGVAPGTYTFTIRATDSSSPPQADTQTYSIVVSSLQIAVSDSPDPTVTGQNINITWTFTVSGSASTPNQNALVELLGPTMAVEDSCTAALTALTCGPLQSTTAGPHTVRLTYPNPPAVDPNFPGTTTASAAHTVNVAPTTTTVTTAPDPSVTGQVYAANVVVAPNPPGGGAPTGTVAVSDGLGNTCNAVLTPGVNQSTGSCNLNAPAAGARTITANYPGDANYAASAGTDPHTVNLANTTTTITSDLPDPSVTGEPYVVNWTVTVNAPGAGTPTGTVTVDDGTGASCSAAVAAGTCTLTSVTAGAKTLTASYSGDANFNASSDTEAHTVNPASTTTTITSDAPDPSVTGQAYTVNVTVDTNAPGTGQPTGTVTINDGQGQNCLAVLAPGPGANQSSGSCLLTSVTTAVTTLTANYPGDANFTASSDTEPHTVTLAPTTTTINSAVPSPSSVGQPTTVTVTVAPNPPGTGAPTGSVTVTDGFGGSCTIAALTPGVNQSTGSCILTSTSTSVTTLTATYSGDTNFAGSVGTLAHTVTAAATTTTINTIVPSPSVVGQAVTVSVTVAPVPPGSGAPTGAVGITDGFGGTCTIAALTPGVNQSTGSCILTSVSTSVTSLTATYSGDANFAGSIGSSAHTVNPAATTTTITADNPDPSTVLSAYTVDFTVAPVAPGAGAPTGTVTVTDGFGGSCASLLTPGVNQSTGSCSLTSNNFNVTTLTANYTGDANYNASSDTEPHTVNALTTVTTITADTPDPSLVGEMVNVTVTVQGSLVGGPPSGTVTIADGIGGNCLAALSALLPDTSTGSCALMPTPATTPAALTFTATYPGDGTVYSGSADTEAHDVNPAMTTTTLLSSANPSVSGQTVTFTATVSPVPPAGGTPTGTVNFRDAVTLTSLAGCGAVALTAGSASCNAAFTVAQSPQTIEAVYSGDANFATSTSAPVLQVINPANTTTTLNSSANPSVSGQNVTFTATVAPVAPGAGTPAGNVEFFVNAIPFATVPLVGGVASTAPTTFTVAGSPRTVDAVYVPAMVPAQEFNTSNDSLNQVTNQSNVVVVVTPPAAPTVTGEAYTVNVTVGAQAPGGGTPSGGVNVNDGTGGSCSIPALAGGMGSCVITSTSAGSKTITADYNGDTEFNPGSGTALHTVNAATTVTTVTDKQVGGVSQNTTVTGEDYEVLVTVVTQAPGSGEPTGTVAIQDDDATQTDSCLAVLVPGAPGSNTSTGVCTILNSRSQNNATDNIVAGYQGDGNFAVSTSVLFPHVVNKGGTGLNGGANIVKSADPTVVGETYTVTVTVNASVGEGNPTGTVDVDDGFGAMCTTGPLAPGPGLNQSTASCMLTSTTTATTQLTATYAGDADFNGVSASNNHTVNAASTTITITSVNPATQSIVNTAYTINFSLLVVAPGSGSPTGNVTVSDGTDSNICALPATSCSLTSTTLGAKNLTATYSGDANFNGSVSPNFPYSIVAMTIATTPAAAGAVMGNGTEDIAIGTGTGPDLTLGNADDLDGIRFQIAGGTAPYTCSLASGSLPAGVTVTAAATTTSGGQPACTLAGTPAIGSAGMYVFNVQAQDNGAVNSASTGNITWVINPQLFNTSPGNPGDAVHQRNYNFTLSAGGGEAPYQFDDNGGSLASDVDCTSFALALNGDLTATPAALQAGDNTCQFISRVLQTATTSTGRGPTGAGTEQVIQVINLQPALTFTTTAVPNAKKGIEYYPASVGGQPGAVIQTNGGTGMHFFDVTAGPFTLQSPGGIDTWVGNAGSPCEGLSFPRDAATILSAGALDTVITGTPARPAAFNTFSETCSFTVETTDTGSGPTGPPPTPPSQAFSIIVFNALAFVAGGGTDTVEVINTETNQFVASIGGLGIGAGGEPDQVAISPDGRYVFVSVVDTDQIVVIDASTGTPVGNSPFAVGASCNGPLGLATTLTTTGVRRLFVACSVNAGGTPDERVVTYDFNPTGGAGGNGALTLFATADFTGAGGTDHDPQHLAITPDGSTVFVAFRGTAAGGEWSRVNAVTGAIIQNAGNDFTAFSPACANPSSVDIAQTAATGNPIEVYFVCETASSVAVLDASTLAQQAANISLGGSTPNTVRFTPDGTRAYASLTGSDQAAVIDTNTRTATLANLPDPAAAANANANPTGITIPEVAGTVEVFINMSGAAAPAPAVVVLNDAATPTSGTNNPIGITAASGPRGIQHIPVPRR